MPRSLIIIAAFAFASPIAMQSAHADSVPQFNLDVACRSAADAAVAPGRTVDGCKSDENTAKQALEQRWTEFVPADRDRCVRSASRGGPASYVDLLTCLDMAKTARSLPKTDPLMAPASR